MTATTHLHRLGQSLWLDTITRELLTSGTLRRYINELSVTGLTSNPTIFERAITNSDNYDQSIEESLYENAESLFFELALQDLTQAADLFYPLYQTTNGKDGWVSLEVSPLLASDVSETIKAACELHSRAACPNLFIKIPATQAGLSAIEETIYAGVPVNVTLLFSCEQYLVAANSYLNAIERRIEAGLDPNVRSVASLFISRWDVAVGDRIPRQLRNRLGIAVAMRTYEVYCDLLDSPRWRRLADAGAVSQKLLWASTGVKDPDAAETLYVEALAAPQTINTLPEKTLLAFARYGKVTSALPRDGGDAELILEQFFQAGIDTVALAGALQQRGCELFSNSWRVLLGCIEQKRNALINSRRSVG